MSEVVTLLFLLVGALIAGVGGGLGFALIMGRFIDRRLDSWEREYPGEEVK